MATINVRVSGRLRWWVRPLLLVGRAVPPLRFKILSLVYEHGVAFDVSEPT